MSRPNHTYGPTCHFSLASTFYGSKGDDNIPPLKAQFFYSSPLPIDDPLTAVPTPNGSESRPTKHAPQPFSAYDNNALEEAWLGLGSDQDRKNHRKLKNSSLPQLTKVPNETRASVMSGLFTKQSKKEGKDAATGQKLLKGDSERKRSKAEDRRRGTGRCDKCDTPLQDGASYRSKIGCTTCQIADTKPAKRLVSPVKILKGVSNTKESAPDLGSANLSSTRTSLTADIKSIAVNAPPRPHGIEAGDAHSEEAVHGSLFNSNCEDLEHVSVDTDLCPSCSVVEHNARAEQQKATLKSQAEESTGLLSPRILAEVEKQKGKDFLRASKEAASAIDATQNQDVAPNSGASADATSKDSVDRSGPVSAQMPETDLKVSAPAYVPINEHKGFERPKHSKDNSILGERAKADIVIKSKIQSSGTGSNKGKLAAPGPSETGITGFPFQRVPSRRGNIHSRSRSPSPSVRSDLGTESEGDSQPQNNVERSFVHSSDIGETIHVHHCKARKNTNASVPVGISRLHLVKLPALQMMPIYWSPIHDIAAVTRGTWFYKDTMYPVEPPVANQLEIGYRELRPWSQTWADEIRSAIEVGAAGEEKISHTIWPRGAEQTEGSASKDDILTAADPFCAARCFHGEVAAVGSIEMGDPDGKSVGPSQITKRFPNSHVMYKDSHNAFILKPSLQPSDYYGRKPLAKIVKGINVGLHVVRGFNWPVWERLHQSNKSSSAAKAEEGAPVAGDAAAGKRAACAACLEREKRPIVTDLILVIHGIGQKLSERVESFHFTHAINSFRRSVNVEVQTSAVRKVLRDDLGGVMVLPVNWRSNLSFEDGGPMKRGDLQKDSAPPDFTLKDITPDTIPAVRNLVSDVMLDIPFYMSHHKPKMIEALVYEANRVYRLWCQNNPEFQATGRVHIIAHSLGSAMALDVLSKQPTSINHVDLRTKKTSTKFFEFDTKNLFFVGSPAGFFLLLNRGQLIPRKGRNKPDAEPGDDQGKEIAGEAGTFGCLAVDNLYNVMHYNDPVAYRLNATIDPLYAATLKNAQVPSATTGWIEAIGNAMRSITPGISRVPELAVGQVTKPPPVARIPSQLEMEVHDFTREEVAEKKFFLLNDNGQIDFFLSSGGGPLEIQYLNMLGAHSSYWGSTDFIRMIVTEVGREPGRSHSLPNMKAVKAGHK